MQRHKIIDKAYLVPFILVTALFYLWAIPNNLNDILIPQFMKSFQLNRLQAGLVQSAFYMGYFLLALPAAYVMDRYNYKTGLIIGLLLFATGAFLFYPAAILGTYGLFLGALFVIASGLAFLETGSNSFIAVLGDPASSAQRLNFSQAFNPLGSMTAVLIGNIFIFSGIHYTDSQVTAMKAAGTYQGYLHHEILRVIPPYMVIGTIILIWVVLIARTKFPTGIETATHNELNGSKKESHGHFSKLLQYPHFIKGVVAQFFYIGAQVGTWSFMIQYVKDYLQRTDKEAGVFLFAALVAFGIGRFVSTALMSKVSPNKLMGLYAIINTLLMTLAVVQPNLLGACALVLSSFFMSLMFPTIFALGVKGLGPNTKIGGSIIIMGIIGGAVWTPVMGLISDNTGSMALAMIVPLIAYLYIIYYAYIGYKPSGPLFETDEPVIASH